MIDIENRLRDVLHADAENVVSPPDLGARAVARAGRIQRRRTVAAVSGVAVAVLAAVLAVPLLKPVTPAPDQAAAGVGSDPDVLHFDIDETAAGAKVDYVYSGPGLEMVSMSSGPSRMVVDLYLGTDRAAVEKAVVDGSTGQGRLVELNPARQREPVTVAGRAGTLQRWVNPGTTSGWVIRWQPRDDLYAMSVSHGARREDPLAAAEAMRLDTVQPCRTPFRAEHVPDGYRHTACGLWVSWYPPGDVHAKAWWRNEDRELHVRASLGPNFIVVPNITVDGRPARWEPAPTLPSPQPGVIVAPLPSKATDRLIVPDLDKYFVEVEGLAQSEAVEVAEGLRFGGEPTDPESWPR